MSKEGEKMRQQDKTIIWPSYFDSARARSDGRRIPKNLAVPSPKIQELKEAAEKIGLDCELVPDVGFPKTPWLKTGMLLVKKKEPKERTIRKIAEQSLKLRGPAITR